MSKRDELIAKYAADLKDKCGVNADIWEARAGVERERSLQK